jgi:hypothetical protein
MSEQPKARAEYDIGGEDFCRIWMWADSLAQAEAGINHHLAGRGCRPMPFKIVIARAAHYRSLGVNLKRFKPQENKNPELAARLNRVVGEVEGRRAAGEGPPAGLFPG